MLYNDEQLTAELTPVPDLPTVRRFAVEWLFDVRKLLNADISSARTELARHVREIRLIPIGEQRNGYYVAKGEWSLLAPAIEER